MTHGLVRHGELPKVHADHVSLDLNGREDLALVDTNDRADHLWDDDHVAEVRLDDVRLVVGAAVLLGLDKLLLQLLDRALQQQPAREPPARTRMQNIEHGIQVNAPEGELAERPLLLQLGSALLIVRLSDAKESGASGDMRAHVQPQFWARCWAVLAQTRLRPMQNAVHRSLAVRSAWYEQAHGAVAAERAVRSSAMCGYPPAAPRARAGRPPTMVAAPCHVFSNKTRLPADGRPVTRAADGHGRARGGLCALRVDAASRATAHEPRHVYAGTGWPDDARAPGVARRGGCPWLHDTADNGC
eukprot:scaffold34836_cov129-Isochrysis_galbana.AAC.1